MLKLSSAILVAVLCLISHPISSQTIIPNKTFFPDMEKEEVEKCGAQANAYGLIAKMRDAKIPAERVIEKLVKDSKMKLEIAKIVVYSVYAIDASEERIKGQIMGECLTTISYEKLIRQSKFI